uniref:Uncharacterized protein n=1 Tax=Candidatus Kentrum sp. FM TaxID=2126340 RepID=A0A450VQ86_9GAMM|nr:MAG: hypothetical protein BECKFM1743A_GA0114220_100118 [Candidatus Kentron sp. FM]VFJ45586.1 MAG: hypothetical protein BECKFM1743C_GA0114222_100279 [Candidatus Kentron sp. FM]VFK06928.1 MAG: hypothetical protein BECKFM1743B_GA0114221_100281 [Candidatus Kentron sp. FM]
MLTINLESNKSQILMYLFAFALSSGLTTFRR